MRAIHKPAAESREAGLVQKQRSFQGSERQRRQGSGFSSEFSSSSRARCPASVDEWMDLFTKKDNQASEHRTYAADDEARVEHPSSLFSGTRAYCDADHRQISLNSYSRGGGVHHDQAFIGCFRRAGPSSGRRDARYARQRRIEFRVWWATVERGLASPLP